VKFLSILVLLLITACSAQMDINSYPTKTLTLTPDNSVMLKVDFNDGSIDQLISDLKKLDSDLPSDYPIYLYLSTPGGYISSGIDLYTFVHGMNRPVHTITSFAASMGFQTVQQLGTRYIMEYGTLMSHKAKGGGFAGEFGDGKSQMDARYNLALRMILKLDEQTVSRTSGKQTLESYRAAYENEMWVTGNEAVALGYADETVNVRCSDELEKATTKIEVETMFSKAVVTLSRCPLNNKILGIEKMVRTGFGDVPLEEYLRLNPTLATCEQALQEKLKGVPCLTQPVTKAQLNAEFDDSIKSITGTPQEITEIYNRKVINQK